MIEPFRIRRLVEFRDTDAAGIMHFSVFFTMMEQAEHAMLRSIGLRVISADGDSRISWPRVSASCDYKSAVRFEDQLEISVTVAQLGDKSVRYRHEFRHADRLVASGEMVAVCCRIDDKHQLVSVAIPAEIRSKLETYLEP